MISEIKVKGRLYAVIVLAGYEKKGLSFFSPIDVAIQAGCWNYDKGKSLPPHIHIPNERINKKTQEAIFVCRGAVKVNIYEENGRPIESFIAGKGDLVILLEGGHGYEILENRTKILEFKNGPFTGVSQDKSALEIK